MNEGISQILTPGLVISSHRFTEDTQLNRHIQSQVPMQCEMVLPWLAVLPSVVPEQQRPLRIEDQVTLCRAGLARHSQQTQMLSLRIQLLYVQVLCNRDRSRLHLVKLQGHRP
jgi:hypothetical protein